MILPRALDINCLYGINENDAAVDDLVTPPVYHVRYGDGDE